MSGLRRSWSLLKVGTKRSILATSSKPKVGDEGVKVVVWKAFSNGKKREPLLCLAMLEAVQVPLGR